ncbi:hypothetical protein [Parasutterella sp.]|uniref:hypothetical protein n=1 Tax=Parasutterella sp. TaxID=2049037 RepID=UPI0035225386
MAGNKKPRKAYKPHPVHITGSFYSRENLNKVKSLINEVGLIVELTLPRAEATEDHMYKIQDVLNWGSMLVSDRKFPGQKKEVDEFRDRHHAALEALSQIHQRKEEGISSRYVGTADELNILRDVCGEICELLKEGMEVSPGRTLREFLAVKAIVQEEHDRREKAGIPHGIHELNKHRAGELLNRRSPLVRPAVEREKADS